MPDIQCVALGPENAADYLEFFDRRAFTDNPRWSGCYCYFPLHDPGKTDWQRRTAPENRTAMAACLATGQAQGFLARVDGKLVGWCHAGPWSRYPMLGACAQPDAATLAAVMCFVVAPEFRGQGLAAALLAAACDGLRRQGWAAVQARPLTHAEGAAANHMGPLSMYLKAGFHVVRETPEGEVLVRKSLQSAVADSL